MKTIFIFLSAILFIGTINAQCYHVAPIVYNHDALVAPTNVIDGDDQYSGKISIGFPFCFYGASYDSILIGSNGVLSFNTSEAGNYCPWPIGGAIPTTYIDPLNAIFFPWQDLSPGAGGTIEYQITGSSPNRKFIVEFDSVRMYSCTGLFFSGQVKLFETTNMVEMDIEQKSSSCPWGGGYAIEGMQNSLGTSAVVVSGRNYPTQWSATNDAWTFTPTCNVCNGVEIAESQNPDLDLFVSGHNQITITPNGNSYKLLSVCDMFGREIKFNQAENTVSLAEAAPGIYIVSLEIKGTRVVKKVMMN
ncbi:MAG TPA: T9SS type A sorting domain-containing protein [Bacteroidia bacterium]|nr:T9SS type A sorting domain-containing protein [Bacteroidia bacterium]